MAPVISTDAQFAAAQLRAHTSEQLVAFPTETVYGLGASALDERAVQRVFTAKQRPAADPLICHVSSFEAARPLWKVGKRESAVLAALAADFWPGPLSLVARSSGVIPEAVNANTGCVAVRVPNHPLALEFLNAVEVPIVGPSANKFSEISPSSAEHVRRAFDTLDKLIILDGGRCQVGIESTVCRVESVNLSAKEVHYLAETLADDIAEDSDDDTPLPPVYSPKGHVFVTVLRQGAVTCSMISACLKRHELNASCRSQSSFIPPSADSLESPGQYLKHYSPRCTTVLVHPVSLSVISPFATTEFSKISLHRATVVDMLGLLANFDGLAGKYFDTGRDMKTVCQNLFAMLHAADALGRPILMPNFTPKDELASAVFDRVSRAAAGQVENLYFL